MSEWSCFPEKRHQHKFLVAGCMCLDWWTFGDDDDDGLSLSSWGQEWFSLSHHLERNSSVMRDDGRKEENEMEGLHTNHFPLRCEWLESRSWRMTKEWEKLSFGWMSDTWSVQETQCTDKSWGTKIAGCLSLYSSYSCDSLHVSSDNDDVLVAWLEEEYTVKGFVVFP